MGSSYRFLTTNFEGGMMGYALFGLLYAGQTKLFAMVDIGQTLFAFTVFLMTLKAVGGEKNECEGACIKHAAQSGIHRYCAGRSVGCIGRRYAAARYGRLADHQRYDCVYRSADVRTDSDYCWV